MRLRNEVKVGFIVTAGVVALIAIYWYLGGLGLRTSTYPIYAIFPNAQRLDKGSLIRMAGVKIGVVRATTLTPDSRARVDLLIDNGVGIAKDSFARVTTGAFVGEYYVEITAGKSHVKLKSGERIATRSLAQPDQLLQQASDIMTELQKSVRGINEVVGDKEMAKTIKATVYALRSASESASRLAASAGQLVQNASPAVARILSNLCNATQGAERVSAQIEDMIARDVQPNVKGTLEQARSAAQKLDDAIQQVQEIVAGFKSTPDKLGNALVNIADTADQAEEMMSNLKDASAGVKSIAADPQLQQQVKTAVRNAAEATQQLKELTESLNKKYGGAKNTPAQRRMVPDSGFTTNALWNTTEGKYRFDANYTFPWTGNSFFRVGAFNIGENTRANLQGGATFGSSALRYGVYASRVGFGFDQRLGKSMLISGDVFRPNEPEMELRGVLRVGGPIGLYGGVLDLLHESNRDVYAGIQYRK